LLRGGLRVAHYAAFHDLSHLAASMRGVYRVQPVPGYSRPWLEISAGAQWLQHRDSDLRDGVIGTAALGAGSQLSDRVRATFNAGLERRNADGPLYDLSQSKLWATLDYRLGLAATAYASAARVTGDQVFNAISATGQGWLAPVAKASAPDPALASEFGGVAPQAYRLDATTYLYEIGVNFPLSGTQSLDLSGSYFDSHADRGAGRYDGSVLRLSYLVRFR
jgi:hypothetical protein